MGELAARAGRDLSGLPRALTSFVGRTEAVDRVTGLVSRSRLVTVTGPGGVGKTRLAGEVLGRVAGSFADGVCVVELAAAREQALVPAMVATALELREGADTPVAEMLAAYLAPRQVLLVLDNCEHVLDATAQLCAALLVAADDIRVLTTSREPLGLPGEVRYRLPPLALPAADGDGDGEAGEAEAVTLFVERARQVDPGFALDGDSAAMVRRLVTQLDGMPLAIELAAARVESLSLAGLLERLDDKFRLLVSPGRGTAARHRSLEATVDWSYQLLTGAEQRAFRQLSVFPGSFTLDAAEAVAGADAGPTVLRLVECSLLLPPRPAPDGRSRYSVLETLRSYAARRLGQAGEEHQAESALAAYALRVAADAAAQLAARDLEQPAALWLDAEDTAVHQALAWSLEHDPPAALRLAVSLAPWWMLRGRWVQGYALLSSAVAQAEPGELHWCTAQVWLGRLALFPGDRASLTHCTLAVDALREKPPSADLVDGLTGQSASLRNMGRLSEAEAAASSALALARQIGHTAGEADALKELAGICMYADDSERAAQWAVQAQRIDQGSMPGWRIREMERILVWVLTASGRPEHVEDARQLCGQALEHAREAGDVGAQADLLFLMEVQALKTGQLPQARRYLVQSAELATRAGSTLRLIDLLDEGGFLCAAGGQHAHAVTLWSAMTAHTQANSLADTAEGERRRSKPLREAQRALGSTQAAAAETRGTAMTLAAAVELAVMTAAEETPPPAAPTASRLSARERELVALVAQGQTDVEIAKQLSISASTVRTHLERIRDKTGCRRRADLTRLALSEGLV